MGFGTGFDKVYTVLITNQYLHLILIIIIIILTLSFFAPDNLFNFTAVLPQVRGFNFADSYNELYCSSSNSLVRNEKRRFFINMQAWYLTDDRRGSKQTATYWAALTTYARKVLISCFYEFSFSSYRIIIYLGQFLIVTERPPPQSVCPLKIL